MKDGLRILELYHDSGPGGAEQMIVDLCHGLAESGHRVTAGLLCHGWLYDQLQRAPVRTFVMSKKRRTDLRFMGNLTRLIRETDADVIHAHEFSSNVSGSVAARWTGRAVVATVHGKEYIASRLRRRLACRWVGRSCDRMVSVSGTIGRFLAESAGVPPEKLQTIYNGIDTLKYVQGDAGEDLRRELGVAPGAPVVGAVGSLYPVKGHTYLVQAMAQIAKQLPSVMCLLIGHGHLRATLEREVKVLGLERHVKFLGYRSDVPRLLGALDLFVLPSLSEGLPLSLLEAMATGRPVVATDVGGNPEVVQDGATGYLVEPRRPDLLADRILELLMDPGRGKAMGVRARATVHERFGVERMVREYERLFREIVAARLGLDPRGAPRG